MDMIIISKSILIYGLVIFYYTLKYHLGDLSPALIWFFFFVALLLNIIIGLLIIATLTGYIKLFFIIYDKALKVSFLSKTPSNNEKSLKIKIYNSFDLIVIGLLVWAIRSAVSKGLIIELFPSINFVFEYYVPEWVILFLTYFGYKEYLSFLENLDLFLGHFIFKLIIIALVSWTLFRNGIGYLKKTAFEKVKKKIWPYLLLGMFCPLTIMNYSTLEPILSIGYYSGVIFGAVYFLYVKNKEKLSIFYFYTIFILLAISVLWLLSWWNLLISFIASIIIIFIFIQIRKKLLKIIGI